MRKAPCFRHRLVPWVMALVLTLFAVACNEHLLEPEAANEVVRAAPSDAGVVAAKTGARQCPESFDVVVTDEAGFLDALNAASPGDVIGVDGMIEITADVEIMTENLTVTCATSGSGFFAGTSVFYILQALAKGVTVDGLVFDARDTQRGPYLAYNDGGAYTAEDVRFTNNTATCGQRCAFFAGVKGAVVVGNTFEAADPGTGVHIQGQGPRGPDGMSERSTDGARVQRNTIIATAPSTHEGWAWKLVGGIRARDGRNIEVSDNIVRGPWFNGMSLDNLYESQIKRNRVEGAVNFGIATGLVSDYNVILIIRDNVFQNNRVTDVGSADAAPPLGLPPAGVLGRRACGNSFFGNNLQGNHDDIGALFTQETGANTLAGNQNVVVDNGHFDCDGDGVADPNIITGMGQVLRDVNLGQIVSSAVHGDMQ